MSFANKYSYELGFWSVMGINLFTLFAWTIGLFGSVVLFNLFYKSNSEKKIIVYIIAYWSLLITLETLAYHVFGFRNLATSSYPGLPLCDCIHAPMWMQATYLLMGPLYFYLCEFLSLKKLEIIENYIKRNDK